MAERTNGKEIVKSKNTDKNKDFVVAGYTFKTRAEAEAAKDERNAIKYLSKNTDGSDPKQVYVLYNKIIDSHLFSTAIGMDYLKELQQFLYLSPDVPDEKIKPIPVKGEVSDAIYKRRERNEHRSELHVLSIQAGKYRNRCHKLIIVNIFLVIAIIAMFIILKTSDNANIVNYEVNIQDKYASWQEELKQEEESLKEKKNELIIREREIEKKEATINKK